MFIKNCPKCNSIMSYSRKGNLNKSIRNNSVCKSCIEWTDERKNKMSIVRKKYLQNLNVEQKQQQIDKMSNSLKQFWNNKTDIELEQWKKSVSVTSKQRWENEQYKDKVKQSIKQSWENLTQEQKQSRIKKSIENNSGICQYFHQDGYKVQGHTEKRYIKHLKENNLNLPLVSDRKGIHTPYGIYFPDFDFNDYYVEVKSPYTYSKLINKLSFDGKTNNKQLDKILWVSQNIKKVKVIIETKRNCFVEVDTSLQHN